MPSTAIDAGRLNGEQEGGRQDAVRPVAGIGLMNENALHAAVKDWCALPGDRLEVPVDGYVVDVVRDGLLIEVQTRNLAAIRDKLRALSAADTASIWYCPSLGRNGSCMWRRMTADG